ncbi:MAG: beta-ketoacyl synthase chain length factor [Gammaproteobacteria bacterium]|nr:beta-ketoacyl synthase chain length factor [Gammaproteobacteria bacterium]
MNAVGIAGIGMVAPGIENWQRGKQVLIADDHYDISAAFPLLKPAALSANERRRTTDTIKIALDCGHQAVIGFDGAATEFLSGPDLTSVFACSCGDLNVVDKILVALTLPGKPVSPTQFHNSVHNAPAGYWSISAKSTATSTSIAAGDHTFSVGLLEAMSQVLVNDHAVLFIAYDMVPPPLLKKHRQVTASYGVALLLSPELTHWSLSAEVNARAPSTTTMQNLGLEQLRNANPAANSLPLLHAIANKKSINISLPYLHGQALDVSINRVSANK